MQKMSTMIRMCILLLIPLSCYADPTGREPQLMASDGTTAATNTVASTNTYPKSNAPINPPPAIQASTTQAPTTATVINNTASSPAIAENNSPNPADILDAVPANDNQLNPPHAEISPDAVVSETINNLMYHNRLPGAAVALYYNGRPYLYHFGVANEAYRTPVTENTIFEIGSITKTFTTLLLGMELDEGHMHLQDSVYKYASSLQRLNGAVNYITLEQLATHTSSLPYELPDYVISSQRLFCNFLNNWRPGMPMGSTWKYSNIGFGLLGYMLEGATAETYDQLLHQRVLNPLGMYHTAIDVPPQLENDYAQGYDWDGSPAKQWRHNDIIPAEGSLKTTSQDMLKYLMASLGVPGTPLDIFSGIRTSCYTYVATRYGLQGLAWEKHPLYSLNDEGYINHTRVLFLRDSYADAITPNGSTAQNDNMLIDKTGTTAGFTAYIALIPSQKIGVVILANKAALREQIGEAGRIILLHLMQNYPQNYYDQAAALPRAAVANTLPQSLPNNQVAYNQSSVHVSAVPNAAPTLLPTTHYYTAPPPPPTVIHVPVHTVVIHRHVIVHHHKHIVIVQETVKHHVIVKKKIIVKKHHVVVKKKVIITTTNN